MSRRWIFDFLGLIFSVITIVVIVDVYVRFFADDGMQFDLEMWKYARDVKQLSADPLIAHEHAPNRDAVLMAVDFRTNSKGLRDREFAYERKPGTLRVLMLGDSLTVGWGVPVEQTFSKRIEKLFANNGVDAEVINAGVGNYNTVQEVEYFLTEGYKYHPDIVVLNFFVNDAEPIFEHKPPSILMRECYACVFVFGRVDTLARKFLSKSDWADYYLGLYGRGNSKGWLDAKAFIEKLSAYSRSNGIALVIANLPELHDVQHYRFQEISDLVRSAASEYGAGYVDLLPFLEKEDSAALWVSPGDQHPNARANELIAQGLYPSLASVVTVTR
jgi:lysophospholipase L1-like esterase